MKQLISKIMGSIAKILTYYPFSGVSNKQKNGNKERPDGGVDTRSPGIQDI